MPEPFPVHQIRIPRSEQSYVKMATSRIEMIEQKREKMSFRYRCVVTTVLISVILSAVFDTINQSFSFVQPRMIFSATASVMAVISSLFDYFLHWRKNLIHGRSPYLLNVLETIRDLEEQLNAADPGANGPADMTFRETQIERLDRLMNELTYDNSMKRVRANYQPN